ncbi:MAG: hypothetical protein NVSMB5_24120 [Candidatus Velthaea sp.]
MKGFHLDPVLAKRALLDAMLAFVVLFVITWFIKHELRILPTLAMAAALFFFRYVQLRRRRDSPSKV